MRRRPRPARRRRGAAAFAGGDVEATDRARQYFTGYPPSSPAVALLKDGKLVYMLERHQIEGNSAEGIARQLTAAFDKYCASPVSA
jgi:putative YphP/YqiW family bacilliredoxin